MTPDEVIAYNVKRLREAKDWSQDHLAIQLTGEMGRKWNRYGVADLEGRRSREVRWPELWALCIVFGCALFDLVLPPEGVEIDVPPGRFFYSGIVDVDGSATEYGMPRNRQSVARLLFHLDAEAIDNLAGLEEWYRDQMAEERKIRNEARRHAVDQLMELARQQLSEQQSEEES